MILSRKQRWTVLGAGLLALLALAALVWFPPAWPGVAAPAGASGDPLPGALQQCSLAGAMGAAAPVERTSLRAE